MRPGRQDWTGEQDLFRARLDRIINMKHELARLARAQRIGPHHYKIYTTARHVFSRTIQTHRHSGGKGKPGRRGTFGQPPQAVVGPPDQCRRGRRWHRRRRVVPHGSEQTDRPCGAGQALRCNRQVPRPARPSFVRWRDAEGARGSGAPRMARARAPGQRQDRPRRFGHPSLQVLGPGTPRHRKVESPIPSALACTP